MVKSTKAAQVRGKSPKSSIDNQAQDIKDDQTTDQIPDLDYPDKYVPPYPPNGFKPTIIKKSEAL